MQWGVIKDRKLLTPPIAKHIPPTSYTAKKKVPKQYEQRQDALRKVFATHVATNLTPKKTVVNVEPRRVKILSEPERVRR